MKKHKCLILIIPFILSSCSLGIPLEFVAYSQYATEQDTHPTAHQNLTLSKNCYFENNNLVTNEISSLSQMESSHDREDVFSSSDSTPSLLVVPLAFLDSDTTTQADKTILLQNAFFGATSQTNYQSVASYYNISSYGHLKMDGEVTPWFTASQTAAYYGAQSTPLKTSSDLANEVVKYLEDSSFDLSPYLSEDGKYVKGLYIVYDYPPNYEDTTSLFWAYVDRASKSTLGDVSATIYAWSSIGFIGEKAYSSHRVSTNTFIHEVGHLFGLRDYYNTWSSSGFQPTGFFDMMDYNLGDHSSFSKYLLDWATPRVVTEGGDYTLSSFAETGDFLLIPTSSWNQTAFDEYLLIEFFTPTGLNSSSSFSSYSYTDALGVKRVFTYPSYHGLRIYHIDARLAYYENATSRTSLGLIDQLSESDIAKYTTLYVGFGYHNSPTNVNSPVLCHLLSSEGDDNFKNSIAASNNTLFTRGDTFGASGDEYENFTFHKNGEALSYSLKVNFVGAEQAKITITAK